MSSVAGYVDVNGRLVAAARARISAFDRGLLYGDGLFETLRAYRGHAFALDLHVARLERSSQMLGIPLPRARWNKRIDAVLRRNRLLRRDARVRITVTRGSGPPTLAPPAELRPSVIIGASAVGPEAERRQRRGARVVLLPYTRHGFLSEHKVLNYLPAILAQPIIARHRAAEGLYVDEEDRITEGTTSNFFAVRRNTLLTAPPGEILSGVTRHYVLTLAAADGLRLVERAISVASLQRADEAFYTSSIAEIVPITHIDDVPVGSGRPGPVTRRLQRLYRLVVAETLRKERQKAKGKRQK